MSGVALRVVHLLAVAVVVGVPVATAFTGADRRRAEWLFWAAVPLVLLGGIANLGTLGSIPPAASRWGAILVAKITLLLVLLVVSAIRLRHSVDGRPAPGLWWTSGSLAGVLLVLGVLLAHG